MFQCFCAYTAFFTVVGFSKRHRKRKVVVHILFQGYCSFLLSTIKHFCLLGHFVISQLLILIKRKHVRTLWDWNSILLVCCVFKTHKRPNRISKRRAGKNDKNNKINNWIKLFQIWKWGVCSSFFMCLIFRREKRKSSKAVNVRIVSMRDETTYLVCGWVIFIVSIVVASRSRQMHALFRCLCAIYTKEQGIFIRNR